MKLWSGLSGTVLVGAWLICASAPAAASNEIARWSMNEDSGASVMRDASGGGHDGLIGDSVVTGVDSAAGVRGYRFPPVSDGRVDEGHLVQVPDDDDAFDPGARDFSVELRLRTSSVGDYNVMQKGQLGTVGGMYKVELDHGHAACTFRGADGAGHAASSETVADGRWHLIRCGRTSDAVSVSVDGRVDSRDAITGTISNGFPVSVGGKSRCDADSVDCDYFVGDIGRLVIRAQ